MMRAILRGGRCGKSQRLAGFSQKKNKNIFQLHRKLLKLYKQKIKNVRYLSFNFIFAYRCLFWQKLAHIFSEYFKKNVCSIKVFKRICKGVWLWTENKAKYKEYIELN